MPTATAKVTGAAQVGRSPADSETVVFATPRAGVGEGPVEQLTDEVEKKRQQVGVKKEKAKAALDRAWQDGVEAAENDDVALTDRMQETLVVTALESGYAANLAGGAIMLLVTLMIVLLAALVGGQFAQAIPSDSPFSESINTTTDNAGTAFTIFGVSLLAIPTVSVLAYIIVKLGPFIGGGLGGGMGGGAGSMMRRR